MDKCRAEIAAGHPPIHCKAKPSTRACFSTVGPGKSWRVKGREFAAKIGACLQEIGMAFWGVDLPMDLALETA